jgi:hypothetical protein
MASPAPTPADRQARGLGASAGSVTVPLIGGLLGGVVVTLLALAVWHHHSGGRRILPGEYLYLDIDRVDAYLGQLSNGLSASEKRSATSTLTEEAGSTAAAGAVKVGVTAQQSRTTEFTVTPTATDRFYTLLTSLENDFSNKLAVVDPTSQDFDSFLHKAGAPHEGEFIKILNARLQVPTFVLPLPKVAYAARSLVHVKESDGARFDQPNVSRRELAELISRHPRAVNRYLKPLGADPEIPTVVRAQLRDRPNQLFTFYLPLQYDKLSDAPALVTGNLTIVGKVIRQLRERKGHPKVDDFRDPVYYDVQAASAYTSAVQQTTAPLRAALHLPAAKADVPAAAVVDASVTMAPPGMVVMPIAIYK